MKVQNEHSTLGCDEHYDEKSNILERYYNCDAPIYSGSDRDVQLKAGVKENSEKLILYTLIQNFRCENNTKYPLVVRV